ncbi:MAG: hypothetical protein IPP31_01795 [Chitinophagaceae bacterium]|nr:hypothetical protein [Chitinophagaceae bacterium]
MLVGSIQKADAQTPFYYYDDKYYDSPLIFEVGGSIGVINCLTDIGGRKGIGKKFVKDINWGKTQFAGGITLGALYRDAIGLRLEYTFGTVTAEDKVLEKVKETTFRTLRAQPQLQNQDL